jgi:hypothetical protein
MRESATISDELHKEGEMHQTQNQDRKAAGRQGMTYVCATRLPFPLASDLCEKFRIELISNCVMHYMMPTAREPSLAC